MGDPIVHQGKCVGYVGVLNMGKFNDGFLIRFYSLEALISTLSLPDSEVLYIGQNENPEDKVTVGEFKKKYVVENGLVMYSSFEQELRHRGERMTQRGVENKEENRRKESRRY